jgi:anti-sigma B factor antagonist
VSSSRWTDHGAVPGSPWTPGSGARGPKGRTEEEQLTVAETFGISEASPDGVAVLSVTGELDIATAPRLREQLESTIEGGSDPVIVDLLGVTFIDSTALGVLIGALKKCRESDTELRLVVAEPRVLKVFEITGLTSVFSVFPTVDAATRG